ncbi:spindle and kinetochore-associated protein 1 isoform X3 [Syngnathoides biaculeatus]|uniref:spindle and kinetochore-associated protein 1 isoform X3 n=1 Tax=Syngnathoides biaculeatus TaxID=300417 RepID=UPI002ADD43B0|nr:spindle and kinetochore-associated protein 1 isoform X3 [Syngnathoides biaculeatus]
MGDLETLSCHIKEKISFIECLLDLSIAEVPQNKMNKLKQELDALERLLMEFEKNVGQQKKQLQHLKALEELFQNLKSLQHLKDNVPGHIPNICPNKENEPLTNQSTVTDVESTQHHTVKIKSYIREMEFITLTEFERIPRYMKGRLSYDQINKAVENINTAVVAKYNIFHQPLKTLNNHARKLYQRFKDQETKDTRGKCRSRSSSTMKQKKMDGGMFLYSFLK